MPKKENEYKTVQIRGVIKDQITDYCNRKGLKIGQYMEKLFQQNMSSSLSGSIGP
jgi:hypothetical protein